MTDDGGSSKLVVVSGNIEIVEEWYGGTATAAVVATVGLLE
jgi:hypothetical protein